MDNVTELSSGISTDSSSLVPKLHPHPRKKGLLFTVWTCNFPNHRLPYSHDVKNLYYIMLSSPCSFPDQRWFPISEFDFMPCYPRQQLGIPVCFSSQNRLPILSVYKGKDVYMAHQLGLRSLCSKKCYCFH